MNISLGELKKSFAKLQEQYKEIGSSPKLNTEADILYYFLCRFPATSKVLEKVFREIDDFPVETLLDIGAGPLSATLQAKLCFPHLKKSIAIENNPLFLEFGKKNWEEDTCELIQDKRDFSQIEAFPEADLGVFSYSLCEAKEQNRIALKAFKAVKYLVIVEPGTPHHNRALLAVRDYLLEQGAFLVSPCPHMRKCPLTQADKWCHFSTRLARSSFHRQIKGAEMGFEDEKYFYMIFSHVAHNQVDNRIISSVRKDKRGIALDICAKDSCKNIVIPKSSPNYKRVSKLEWGDSF